MYKEIHSAVNFLLYVISRGQKARRYRWFSVTCTYHADNEVKRTCCDCLSLGDLELFKAYYCEHLAMVFHKHWHDTRRYYRFLTLKNFDLEKGMRLAAIKAGFDPWLICRHVPYTIHIGINKGLVTASLCIEDMKRTVLYDEQYQNHVFTYCGHNVESCPLFYRIEVNTGIMYHHPPFIIEHRKPTMSPLELVHAQQYQRQCKNKQQIDGLISLFETMI